MLSNIREILVITNELHLDKFKQALGNGKQFGLEIEYKVQQNPNGIAESLILGEKFLSGSKAALILGDNLFHGPGLGRRLETFSMVQGTQIFGYKVQDPSAYGVATLDGENKIIELAEKPINSDSKVAIPGLYFFDETAPSRAKNLKPSLRGELEILDLLQDYLDDGLLKLEMLPRGTAWFDSGTFQDLHEASSYVKLMQERTGERVGDPFEIAQHQGWIN